MSAVAQACDQLQTDCDSLPGDIDSLNSKINTNMETALEDRNLWQKFWNWLTRLVSWANEQIAKLREVFDKIWDKIEEDILPFIFAPLYLDSAGDKFGGLSQEASSLAGRMAAGQIQPAAEWSGIGHDAYETTRGQQEDAAKVTAEGIQGLSEQLHKVAVNLIKYWQQVTAGIGKFLGDSLAELGQLLDVKKWTEVIPVLANIANGFYQLLIDQMVALTEYITTAIPLMDDLNRQIMSNNMLAGGDGWPKVAPAMTQPSVPGEPPTWNDGDDGPNI